MPDGRAASPRRYTEFEQGLMAAAYHLNWMGEDTLRDEVLRLAHLTMDDFRREHPDE